MLWEKNLIDVVSKVDNHLPGRDFPHFDDQLVTDFRTAAQQLRDPSSRSASRVQLASFLDAARTKLTSPSAALWRIVFANASLLLAVSHVVDMSVPDEKLVLHCIAMLDQAIVIVGGGTEETLELIISTIQKLQSDFFPPRSFEPLLGCVPPSVAQAFSLETASHEVQSLGDPPNVPAFQRQFSAKPFVLRGYILDWPALSDHPWSSTDYLRFVGGPGRIVPVEVGRDYRTDDWTPRLMSWDDFLCYLDRTQPAHDVLYLAQHNLFMQFPRLHADIEIPDYVFVPDLLPSRLPGYAAPGNPEKLVINAWLGPGGTISPPHTDPHFNFYAQVVGRKTVWLAPPDVTSSMYPYPAPTASSAGQTHNPAANMSNPSMSNTSQVDAFPATSEDMARSRMTHQEFWENVVPHALSVTLEPGDLLFFPPGWWHAMRSEETSFSVSMWF